MDGTRDCHVEQNEPDSERQISHAFCHMQNLDLKKKTQKWKGIHLGRGSELEEEGCDKKW
jgi:hypothetical protein